MEIEDECGLIAPETDNSVPVEILDRLRFAEALHIRVRRVCMVMDREQAALDQIRLSGTTQADRHIRFTHGEIKLIVGENQLHIDIGISVEKFRNAFREPNAADTDRRSDFKITGGALARFGQTLPG